MGDRSPTISGMVIAPGQTLESKNPQQFQRQTMVQRDVVQSVLTTRSMTAPGHQSKARHALGLLVLGSITGCADPSSLEDLEANEPMVAASMDTSVDELSRNAAGEVLCTLSKAAGAAALVGSVVCWVVTPAAAPACAMLATTGVTAAKLTNVAGMCLTGCGLAGNVCRSVASIFSGPRLLDLRIHNVGCNARGDYAAERDVCAQGLNRIYPRGTPEASRCVAGQPTGFWALSAAERSYIRDQRICAARGLVRR